MYYYGIYNAADRTYGLAAALTYWVFKCRDREHSPAMGTKTWTYLESSIQNAAAQSARIEDYISRLAVLLHSHLRPAVLTQIVQPEQRIVRVNSDLSEIREIEADQKLVFIGWHGLLKDAAQQDGTTEWNVLELCRNQAVIIQVLCRIRFDEDRAMGTAEIQEEDAIEVEGVEQ